MLVTIVSAIAVGSIPVYDVLRILLGKIPGLENLFSFTYPLSWETIIFRIKLPRVLLGALVGASLAVSGTCLQGLFRNPMADPFVIGISSGAALGAVIALALEKVYTINATYVGPFFAFAGALGAVLLVYGISRVGRYVPVETLVLAGVAVAAFLSAVTSVVVYEYSGDVIKVFFWMTGSVGAAKWIDVMIVLPVFLIGTILLFFFSRDLNGVVLGEETAQSLGIDVETTKKIILAISSLITASAVVTSGTIGFVGLITPHIMRLFVGPDHRILIPSSAIAGGIFLIWCDAISRTIINVPVAMVTALFGGPFFIYLLIRRKRSM